MVDNPYPFTNKIWQPDNGFVATFESQGSQRTITKLVSINPYQIEEMGKACYNLGFGDLVADTDTGRVTVDDKVESNNGDIVRVFNTVVSLLDEFFGYVPDATVHVGGSTNQRISVYCKIISRKWGQVEPYYFVQGYDGQELEDFKPGNDYIFILISKKP